MNNNKPQWLPNWKDIEEYSKGYHWVNDNEMNLVFAWQFLRRNPDYQLFYNEIRNDAEIIDEQLQNRKPGVGSNCVIGNYGYCQKDGITSEPRGKRDPEFDKKFTEVISLYPLAGYLPCPSNNNYIMPPLPFVFGTTPGENIRQVSIDIRYPIQPQLDRAAEILKSIQLEEEVKITRATHKNRHYNALVRYLRVLDADLSGATNIEIIETIHPDKPRYSVTATDKPSSNKNSKGSHSPAHKALNRDRKEAYLLRETDWRTLLD